VPGAATSTIQELHIVLAHTLCECVEAALFDDAADAGDPIDVQAERPAMPAGAGAAAAPRSSPWPTTFS
jgi:D-sedoheptulose 7-phosphate isomerase